MPRFSTGYSSFEELKSSANIFCIYKDIKTILITVYSTSTNVVLYPRKVETAKAILCDALYASTKDGIYLESKDTTNVFSKEDPIWFSKKESEIVSVDESGVAKVEVTPWYFANVLKGTIFLD